MANVHPGYRGLASIGNIGNVRFADASIAARQEINAPDLIMGDWDHDAYVYGPIEVGGSISGPVTETFASGGGDVLEWACKRTGDCGELDANGVTLYYFCGAPDGGNVYRTRSFSEVYVNSMNFSVAAGDIANFSLDVVGKSAGDWTTDDPPRFNSSEKLITWDKTSVSVSGGTSPAGLLNYSNFDFTVSNNIETVYSLGQTDLFPFELVPGLRTITGSISVYNTPRFDGADAWDDYVASGQGSITFNIGVTSISMQVRFHRVEPASSVGPVISTVGFTGVTSQSGTPWD